MDIIQQSDELAIFKAKAIIPFVTFKWDKYGWKHHFIGLVIHFVQIVLLVMYVKGIYIDNILENCYLIENSCRNYYVFCLLLSVTHTFIYEILQMLRIGLKLYLRDPQNYLDMLFIMFSILTIGHHFVVHPFTFLSKAVLIVAILFNTLRTLKCMRIFTAFSPIVIMLDNVLWQLRFFVLFYVILLAFFSLGLNIVGLGNRRYHINPIYSTYSKFCMNQMTLQYS